MSYERPVTILASSLDRGMKTELCCLLDEGVLKFDGELSVGLEVREEDERGGRELVDGLAALGVKCCHV